MYNTYLCDQNQQSIFSVFCTDLKKNWAGIAGDTVDFSELNSAEIKLPVHVSSIGTPTILIKWSMYFWEMSFFVYVCYETFMQNVYSLKRWHCFYRRVSVLSYFMFRYLYIHENLVKTIKNGGSGWQLFFKGWQGKSKKIIYIYIYVYIYIYGNKVTPI